MRPPLALQKVFGVMLPEDAQVSIFSAGSRSPARPDLRPARHRRLSTDLEPPEVAGVSAGPRRTRRGPRRSTLRRPGRRTPDRPALAECAGAGGPSASPERTVPATPRCRPADRSDGKRLPGADHRRAPRSHGRRTRSRPRRMSRAHRRPGPHPRRRVAEPAARRRRVGTSRDSVDPDGVAGRRGVGRDLRGGAATSEAMTRRRAGRRACGPQPRRRPKARTRGTIRSSMR